VELLRRCIDTLESVTSYPDFRITILDNDSIETETLQYLSATTHHVVECPGPFNYAAIINRGVSHTRADVIVTMNNDVVVETPYWLQEMVGVATMDNVGIVGCTQIDQSGAHDHDGIIIAPYPQHLRRGVNYFLEDESMHARRDVSAVTGAVQLIHRDLWEELGGMDEMLTVVLNDVDLCLRAHIAGRSVVMLPDVVVVHDAGSTRGRLEPLADRNRFVQRWDVFGDMRDPYFSNSLRLLGSEVIYRPRSRWRWGR
jgi:GT2 family glycosyltransferase